MKQKLLLTLFIASINLAVNAQKSTTYAITGSQKGQNNWTEVRLVNIATGEELKTVYKQSEETKILNARTGKPVKKKEISINDNFQVITVGPDNNVTFSRRDDIKFKEGRIVEGTPGASAIARELIATQRSQRNVERVVTTSGNVEMVTTNGENKASGGSMSYAIKVKPALECKTAGTPHAPGAVAHAEHPGHPGHPTHAPRADFKREVIIRLNSGPSLDKPFSTYSAAAAYDKKHDRLYYTPMGIAQLRYIDLKSKTPQVFYFEGETFGALRHRGDIANQITRMVIGADGNGYALTNNAEHLIKFTTDKKAVVTDLGALTDDAANGKFSVRSSAGYGGDIIASKNGDLYLITANRRVFKIDVKNMLATYKGSIQGLPGGYSTNGAAVEGGSVVLVNSSNSTQGYYKFDMNTLVAEKVENSGGVFNASDLANANLLSVKEKKEEKPEEPVVVPQPEAAANPAKPEVEEMAPQARLGVYPNPVTNGVVNLLLDNYANGRYQAKLIDVSGKQLASKSFTIGNKRHSEPFNLPGSIAKGNYLIQLYDQTSQNAGILKLVVQ